MNHPPSSKTWTDFRSLYIPENKPQNPKGLGKLQRYILENSHVEPQKVMEVDGGEMIFRISKKG